MYCSNCGLKVDPEDFFCSGCGKEIKIKTVIKDHESCPSSFRGPNFTQTGDCSLNKLKKSIRYYSLTKFWVMILICVIGCMLTVYSVFALDSPKSHGNSSEAQDNFRKEINIQTCEKIATEYYGSHTYTEDGIYDCDDMAKDVWNMLKAKGINARIAVGDFESGSKSRIEDEKPVRKNLDSVNFGKISSYNYTYQDTGQLNSDMIDNLTHAWVLAEVSPGFWLAIECTGGYVVYSNENENYYHGLTFSNPKNYRSFLDLYRDWKMQTMDYENEKLFCNRLAETYNNASYSEKLAMKSSMEIAEDRLREKEQVFLEIDSGLKALLRGG